MISLLINKLIALNSSKVKIPEVKKRFFSLFSLFSNVFWSETRISSQIWRNFTISNLISWFSGRFFSVFLKILAIISMKCEINCWEILVFDWKINDFSNKSPELGGVIGNSSKDSKLSCENLAILKKNSRFSA